MRTQRKIKVLVVDDSLMFREIIAKNIALDPSIEVVGTAADPYMARDKIIEFQPDVMTLDVEMPKMNGIEFLKRLMPQYPIPVVVVSSVSSNVFEALSAGAIDFVTKSDITSRDALNAFLNELIIKIKIASTAKVGHYKNERCPYNKIQTVNNKIKNCVIAIGASTGGTEAIYSVIKSLPADMPGIVIVQHMPPVFTKMYAERLNNSCLLEVKEAEDGDIVAGGRVLIAAGGYHMELKKDINSYYVKCYKGEKVNGHCPSVDVLFNSVSKAAGKNSIGVILTGMGSDGAKGLLNMKKSGAYTIGQDEKSCAVYGMPMVAFDIGAVIKQMPLDKIPETILDYLNTL